MQLKIVRDTIFKQTPDDAALLPAADQVTVPAGTTLEIHSWKVLNQSHIRIALLGKFLGSPPRTTWCAYTPDLQLVSPARIRVTRDTIFKRSPSNPATLPSADKVLVSAGTMFNIQSWATAAGSHFRLSLLSRFLGEPPRNTWYVSASDMQFISTQPQIIPLPQPAPGRLPASKQLTIPHKSQLDNALNPTGSCNVTAFAMVMTYFQIRGINSVVQLEDELYQYMENQDLSRWDPNDLVTMSRNYGLTNDFTMQGKLSDIRRAIAEGRPCIIHGYFTNFGHIIVVRGYDLYGFFVNDPYGEWTPTGYRNDRSGENLYYSNALIQEKCSPEGEDYIWLHRLSRQSLLGRAKAAAARGLAQITSQFSRKPQ